MENASHRRVKRAAWTGLAVGIALAAATSCDLRGPTATAIPHDFETPAIEDVELDSLAVWPGETTGPLLFITGKKSDSIHLANAVTGELLGTVGSNGLGPGDLRRPNGIAVLDNLLFVVERDNRRIQVFSLPDFETVAIIGRGLLHRPYGIAACRIGEGIEMFVTDDYQATDDNGEGRALDRRVKHFRMVLGHDDVSTTLVRSFGDTSGPGILTAVESVEVDPERRLVFLCDEFAKEIKVYDFDGSFTGRVIGSGIIENDPEGIVFFTMGDRPLLLLSDQGIRATLFRIFDTETGQQAAEFVGSRKTANTDGIALDLTPQPGFPRGLFYAVDDDTRVHAYSWERILEAISPQLAAAPGGAGQSNPANRQGENATPR